jgi:SRSO17 transposase
VAASWPERRWQRLAVAEGEKGLIARCSISDPTEIPYYLSNATADTPLLQLAQVAATRYTVEQCIEEAKGEIGLDEYEVRYRHSWHRRIIFLVMGSRLTSLRPLQSDGEKEARALPNELTVPEVRRLLELALPLPYRSWELRLAWSLWRRSKRM